MIGLAIGPSILLRKGLTDPQPVSHSTYLSNIWPKSSFTVEPRESRLKPFAKRPEKLTLCAEDLMRDFSGSPGNKMRESV